MMIEVDNERGEIILDGVVISFEILKALAHPDGSFYHMTPTENDGVLVTKYPAVAIMVDPDY
jgi:hypothetical protein